MGNSKTGRMSRAAVNVRTHEIAAHAGRVPPQVSQADYEQAKREITGETDVDRQNTLLDLKPAAAAVIDKSRDHKPKPDCRP